MRRGSVLGVRTIRRRLTRFALTAIGVALGIGVLFAVLITNATIDAGFDRLVGRQDVPRIQLQSAGGFDSELRASVVDAAAQLPEVVDVSGGTGVFARIPSATEPDRDGVFINGGFLRDGHGKPPPRPPKHAGDIILRGRTPADAKNEVVLSDAIATQLHARIGSTVELIGPTGPIKLEVVGLYVRRDGKSSDDREAGTSYATARALAGRGEVINYGTIRLAKDTDLGRWLADHGDALGPSVRMISNANGIDAFRDVLGVGKAALAGLAAVALFVCGFLIFLTQSMSVAESSAVHGTMRAIGASRSQVRRVVLSDAVLLTALAAPAGLGFGLLAAFGIIAVTRSVFGLPHLLIALSPWDAAIAVAVGVVVTIVAALLPAQRAARVAPIAAIRGDGTERGGVGRSWIVGVAALVGGVVFVFVSNQRRVDVGSFVILIGAVLVVPALMRPVTALTGRLTHPLARGVGGVGVAHLRKEPRRSAYTVALIMVVLAMVFTTGAVHLSLRHNLVTSISQQFPGDLAVFAGASFDADVHAQVLATPGVRAGTDVRFTRAMVSEPAAGFVNVTVLDPATFFRVQGIPWHDGNDRGAKQALTRGGAVIVPTSFAYRRHVGRGDVLTLATTAGPKPFRVAGVYLTSQGQAPMLAGVRDAPALLGGDALAGVGTIVLAVKPGHDPATVKAAIEERFAGRSPVFVRLTSAEKADFIRTQTTFFQLVYALVLIAAVMGGLGITNTLAMAVLRRSREIGILRAVGTERRQLRRMAVVEAATLALAGLVLAVPLGLLLSVTVLRTVANGVGIVVAYRYPWPMFGVVAVVAVAVAVVSAIVPGRHAVRVEPARVLRFD